MQIMKIEAAVHSNGYVYGSILKPTVMTTLAVTPQMSLNLAPTISPIAVLHKEQQTYASVTNTVDATLQRLLNSVMLSCPPGQQDSAHLLYKRITQ